MDDDYPTCARTYATLLIYPGEIDPAAITERLGIDPSDWQRRGEVRERPGRPPRVAPLNAWSLTSKGQVESRDSRRHVAWLLDRLMGRAEAVRHLREDRCRIEISCYWLSQSGQGRPTILAAQMRQLGELDIELWFDIYGPIEDEDSPLSGGGR